MKHIYKYDKELGKMVEVVRVPRRAGIATWPIHSEAMACNVEDIPIMRDGLAKLGVPTEFDGDGRPILRDRKHRYNVCRALGYYDRDASYGDATPLHYNGQ